MKALVLASGGVDSTTCLGLAVNKYGKENVIALTVAYGQKHTKEIEAARKTAEYYGVEHLYLDKSDHQVLDTDRCLKLGLSTDKYNAANQSRDDVWRDWPTNYGGAQINSTS